MGATTTKFISSNELKTWSTQNQKSNTRLNTDTTRQIMSAIQYDDTLSSQLRKSCHDECAHAFAKVSLFVNPATYDENRLIQFVRNHLNVDSELTIKVELRLSKTKWYFNNFLYIYDIIIHVASPVTPQ